METPTNKTVISVVTATFNSASTIADTLESIDGQTCRDYEHWIIDGASKDDTLKVASSFASDRRHVLSEPDDGVYDGMNRGIAASRGDVIGFLNADDFYESDEVLGLVTRAFEDSSIDVVYGNLRYVDSADTAKVIRDWASEPFRAGMFRFGWMPPHPTVYARRKVFEEVGVFDQSFSICADWEWLFRVFELGGYKICHMDRYFVRMRVGGVSNSSASNVLRSNREAMKAFRKHGQSFPIGFFPGKVIHRGKQFLQRKASGS